MKEFNNGWWNCFHSFWKQIGGADACMFVALDAGVTKSEIDRVIMEDIYPEDFNHYLENELKNCMNK